MSRVPAIDGRAGPRSPSRRRSPSRPLIPIWARFQPSRAWYAARTRRAPRSAVGWVSTHARWMTAGSKDELDMKDRGDPSQRLEPDTFGQPVFDHGPRALAYSAGLAQSGLRFQSQESRRTELETKVQDHRLDREGLVTQVVGHSRIGSGCPHPRLTSHLLGQSSSGFAQGAPSGRCLENLPREIVDAYPLPGAPSRYNRRLIGRGTATPRLACAPGGPIA
jgi:hypothetical protein